MSKVLEEVQPNQQEFDNRMPHTIEMRQSAPITYNLQKARPMPEIFFIRHAESEANAGLPTALPKEVKLTKEGKRQARELAKYLSEFFKRMRRRPSLIVLSPYKRARQTAWPTKKLFRETEIDTWNVQEFTYLSSLHAQSMTIEERRPEVIRYWLACQPGMVDGSGAESFEQFIRRVQSTWNRCKEYSEEDLILIFSHGQFIRAFGWLWQKGLLDKPLHTIEPNLMKEFKNFLDDTKQLLSNGWIWQIPSSSHRRSSCASASEILVHDLSGTVRPLSRMRVRPSWIAALAQRMSAKLSGAVPRFDVKYLSELFLEMWHTLLSLHSLRFQKS